MAKFDKSIISYLHLKDIGTLEMLFALTPMLSGFRFMGLPLSDLMWLVLILFSLNKKGKILFKSFSPLLFFALYWAAHQVIIMLIDDVNINGLIFQIVFFIAVYFLYPKLDKGKLIGSMNLVAIIAIGGLLYQWTFIVRGQGVHPLEIPGLTLSDFILEKVIMRPSSFFMEPSAYVAFMICPLFFALEEKKYWWSILIIISVFLTTSTTGIAVSFIMLTVSLLKSRNKLSSSTLLLVVIGVCLFFALTRFEAFSAGVEKIENTEVSTNVRLSQGPYVVGTMHTSEFVFGAPYSTPYNYCIAGRAPEVQFYGESVYMSTFWQMILLYGVIGLLLYLNIYYHIFKRSRITWPLVVSLCAVMFSSNYSIGNNFIYTLIVLLVLLEAEKRQGKYSKLGIK